MGSFLVLGTYYAAVIENRADFAGRVVVDVGAGSGILSLFAAQVALALCAQSEIYCDTSLSFMFILYILTPTPWFLSTLLFLVYQAGAKHVYAVEASEMAEYARKLIAGNPSLGQRITVRFLSLDFSLIDTVVNVPFLILVWGTFLSEL